MYLNKVPPYVVPLNVVHQDEVPLDVVPLEEVVHLNKVPLDVVPLKDEVPWRMRCPWGRWCTSTRCLHTRCP